MTVPPAKTRAGDTCSPLLLLMLSSSVWSLGIVQRRHAPTLVLSLLHGVLLTVQEFVELLLTSESQDCVCCRQGCSKACVHVCICGQCTQFTTGRQK